MNERVSDARLDALEERADNSTRETGMGSSRGDIMDTIEDLRDARARIASLESALKEAEKALRDLLGAWEQWQPSDKIDSAVLAARAALTRLAEVRASKEGKP